MSIFSVLFNVILYFVLPMCGLAYWWINKKFSFWKNNNVPGPEPDWKNLAGNMRGVGTTTDLASRLSEIYYQYKGKSPAVGIYMSVAPSLLVIDPNLTKTIFVKDFAKFHDHGFYFNEKDDPISAHLFNLEGEKWKTFRTKLSPTFTSGKLKMMFSSIEQVGDRFISVVDDLAKNGKPIDAKDLSSRFTADVVGSTAFGLEINSLNGESDILEISKKIANTFRFSNLGLLFKMTFKDLSRKLRLPLFDKDITGYFMNMLTDTVESRENNGIIRNDFLQLLLQLKNKGFLEGEAGEKEVQKMTFNEIAAQAFVFFFAGFDTSATAMNFIMYQLATHEEIQEKAQKEVLEMIKKHGKLSYEALMDMEYLNQIFSESLRIHPPAMQLIREATEDYVIPNTDMKIAKGTSVVVMPYLFQMDPEYFPDPQKFDPDRFSKENVATQHPFTYLPFGEGPRICIGSRFAQLQSRFALALLLQNFKLTLNDKTKMPLEFEKSFPGWLSVGGIWLNATRI